RRRRVNECSHFPAAKFAKFPCSLATKAAIATGRHIDAETAMRRVEVFVRAAQRTAEAPASAPRTRRARVERFKFVQTEKITQCARLDQFFDSVAGFAPSRRDVEDVTLEQRLALLVGDRKIAPRNGVWFDLAPGRDDEILNSLADDRRLRRRRPGDERVD